jgi:hypothetical protein
MNFFSFTISRKYKDLHTICERFLLIKWNIVQIIDNFFIILGKLSQTSLMVSQI